MTAKLNSHQIAQARQASDECHDKSKVADMALETLRLIKHQVSSWNDYDEVEAGDRRDLMRYLDHAQTFLTLIASHNLVASVNLARKANDLEEANELAEAITLAELHSHDGENEVPF